uniref:Ig-like domain-containing protein n=1 Tax=Amphilophus citrinellus TaxID=61819 RepID=A0A3Q0SH16_AMPCI
MSAGTCASLCSLTSVLFPLSEQRNITAESGQNIILPCRAPNKNQIRAVVWAKPVLEDEHVYLYRDGRFDPGEQNPVYRNRVDLQDRQMKDGDVSLIMKNVTVNDSGTYECRIIQIEKAEFSVSVIRGEAASWLLMFDGGDEEAKIREIRGKKLCQL